MDTHSEVVGRIDYAGTLDAVLIRGDGSHRDCGSLSKGYRLIGRPIRRR